MYIKVKRELCARLKDVMLRSNRRRFTSLGAGSLVWVGKNSLEAEWPAREKNGAWNVLPRTRTSQPAAGRLEIYHTSL